MDKCQCYRPDLQNLPDGLCCMSCGYFGPFEAQSEIASTSSGHAKYHYKQLLSDNYIRLVRLRGGSTEDDLQCDILLTTLEGHWMYEALSYTWGDNTTSNTIYTPEGSLGVTANLYAALRDLRFAAKDQILWVDAICINQDSNSEKNHQVPLMRSIFAKAKRVVIYVGPDATQKIVRLFKCFNDTDYHHFHHPGRHQCFDQLELSEFLSRPWWSRVWILQEVAVAKEALLMCGTATIDWANFTAAHIVARKLVPSDQRRATPPVLLLPKHDATPLRDFMSLIHTARSSKSSDPRDKVYALLGLLSPDVHHTLVANYDVSMCELYVELFMNVIAASRSLDLLCFIGRETHSSRSFNWRDEAATAVFATEDLEHQEKENTSRELFPSWMPQLGDSKILASHRYIGCGQVTWRLPLASICTKTHDHEIPALAIRIAVMDAVTHPPCTWGSLYTAGHRPRYSRSANSTWYGIRGWPPRRRNYPSERFFDGRTVRFTNSSWIICYDRVRTGDKVCLIYGAGVPFVLRPVEQKGSCQTFKLLGECFMDNPKYALEYLDRLATSLEWERVCLI